MNQQLKYILEYVPVVGTLAVVGLTYIKHRRTGASPILIIGASVSVGIVKVACAFFAFSEALDGFFPAFVNAYRKNKKLQAVSSWVVKESPSSEIPVQVHQTV